MSGLELIAAERRRQKMNDWTPAHDDANSYGELAMLACYYVWPGFHGIKPDQLFPLTIQARTDKSEYADRDKLSYLERLVKAGACLVAEIERHERHLESMARIDDQMNLADASPAFLILK